MRLTRTQVNRIVRVMLIVVGIVAFGFTLLAAHPAYRYFGSYPAAFDTPQPLIADMDTLAAAITASHPAVVVFPAAWNLGDRVCMVLRVLRGDAVPKVPFDEYQPQIQWDTPPADAIVIQQGTFTGFPNDGSSMYIDNRMIEASVSQYTIFHVHWFGQDDTPLYKDQQTGGLTCFKFQFSDGLAHVPTGAHIEISAKNVHMERVPAYYFSYAIAPNSTPDPPQRVSLERIPVVNYLSQLVIDEPFAVNTLPPPAIDARATELAPGKP